MERRGDAETRRSCWPTNGFYEGFVAKSSWHLPRFRDRFRVPSTLPVGDDISKSDDGETRRRGDAEVVLADERILRGLRREVLVAPSAFPRPFPRPVNSPGRRRHLQVGRWRDAETRRRGGRAGRRTDSTRASSRSPRGTFRVSATVSASRQLSR